MNLPKNHFIFTACVEGNLALIEAKFGRVPTLTLAETADFIRSTANNITQMIKRGHVPFDLVRFGARIFFPTLPLAAWLCGEVSFSPANEVCVVDMPQRTTLKVKSKSDYDTRLMAIKMQIESRANKLRDLDDQTGFIKAKRDHEKASRELIELVENQALADYAGVPLDTPKKRRVAPL